jgi:hypothetical protein
MYQTKQEIVDLTQVIGKRKRSDPRALRAPKVTKTAYYGGNAQQNKPLPYGKPALWADKRQGICETLPYYNAYQSGAYTHDRRVYGFMCDKEVGDRDVFTDQIMIARV